MDGRQSACGRGGTSGNDVGGRRYRTGCTVLLTRNSTSCPWSTVPSASLRHRCHFAARTRTSSAQRLFVVGYALENCSTQLLSRGKTFAIVVFFAIYVKIVIICNRYDFYVHCFDAFVHYDCRSNVVVMVVVDIY